VIDLYFWPTPNGWKVSILLEELDLPYNLIPINIGKGEQFAPEFLRISPNNRMPAIVDSDGPEGEIAIFESGAIMCYLAEKTARFMPSSVNARYDVMQWVFWQIGGLGPMAGQLSHFVNYAPEPNPYSHKRYAMEYDRLIGVMDRQLAEREYLAGDYSIADMAAWPWLVPAKRFEQSFDDYPNVYRWREAIKARPAVQRGMDAGKEHRRTGPIDEEARKVMFGQTGQAQGE
jgi:GST-like protein